MTWLSRFKIGALLLSTMTLAAAARAHPFPTNCSNENQTCTFSGTQDVAYGAAGQYILKHNVQGSIGCNGTPAAFNGDPADGYIKACYIPNVQSTTTPSGYTFCANECVPNPSNNCGIGGDKCYNSQQADCCHWSGSGDYDVAFGVNARYYIQTVAFYPIIYPNVWQ